MATGPRRVPVLPLRSSGSDDANTENTYWKTKDITPLQSAPDGTGIEFTTLPAGIPVEIVGSGDNWSKITLPGGLKTWIFEDFLELSGNLLDNACKWCKSTVNIAVTSREGGGMRLTVGDDGPGIPEDAAGLLLERGMRLDESEPGHGIGLAIVKEIAASHGGELKIVRSSLGGAEISVTIPA